MKEAKTKIQKFGATGIHIYIPSDVRKDSQNPLKAGDEVMVSVDGKKMTITPVDAAKQKTGAATAKIHRDDWV
ncbi:MAG: hypothetical protein MPEBLZ_01785 [Candidatus Methanoperedens nitroreducens]|uniref:SpoVT-AbrB domain-containing protein n=1 Tax=Candidatus Methanoperedens nitratireducens TaxID=1392998 RepID=A0A0N8KR06_9EURY|nr:AbrB/MazE/SpoVT family DNA-binding domain-containing protein [Candidatus Methanoperedens sp. BLZ2]KAB2948460.1 MAG: AbrB/MazE/SpoVT family DNA-binding domain-containing protein [Candidatus Methanoperedens sp.]KPQ43602.1 MAG: hypothetical protein MPEBLZ_01785 [Candidatus Methanoperedens sp. BLZ1]MBZ0174441.1 AbrB/MazE/SpoVT family DNA-binding domain-containing protein [Candidatus Methanoperedens nitroreducens]MCX9078461.1 AbrB/MazE/SpoVT family DNA-binding domain-containing protein [Candidatu